jgi:hypothetical protein
MFKKKNEKPIVSFVTTNAGLSDIDEVRPKPTSSFIPQWWKDIDLPEPFTYETNVKNCPSFPDYFSQGYIMPMWSDTIINFDHKLEQWDARTGVSGQSFLWEHHGHHQFLEHMDASIHGSSVKYVLKPVCPWQIITPPGYSILQLPVFYNFNKDWTVLPGIIHTDIFHEINQQFLFHSEKEKIIINRGEPIAHYIPFERKKYGIDVRKADSSDIKKIEKSFSNINTKILGTGAYKKLKKENGIN